MTPDGDYTDLVDVLESSVERHADCRVFGTKSEGAWHWMTYAELGRRVDDFRGGLASLGVGQGDTVAVISGNRVEWAVGAYAAYGLGARYCPMYETQAPKDWEYIVSDSDAKVLLTSTYAIYESVRDWAGKVGAVEHVFCMSLPAEDEASFRALEERGRAHPAATVEIDPQWVCGFIYTSGTTGKPKGVLLSHANICSNINSAIHLFPIETSDVSVSFLPWAHSFGQTCELHGLIARGAAMAIAESVDKLVDNFIEVRPTVLYAVPRVFNRIYDGLQKRIAEGSLIQKMMFQAAMDNAVERKRLAAAGKTSAIVELKHALFDRLVFAKVRRRFGGRLRYALSGGAALSPDVAEFIDNLGIVVCEGYGLTETSPVATTNYPAARKIGSVGRPIDGVEILIDTSAVDDGSADGEIIVKGPNVMLGYHNLPQETAAVMTADGGFRTGDLGRLDEDGFLYVTGRIKEQYKLENGKYVVPAPLEGLLQLSPYISQAFLHGANKLFNVALLVPDRPALERWARQRGLGGDWQELLDRPETHALFAAQVDEYGKSFKSYERPKKIELLSEEFSIGNGMLTPKMSLKRNAVLDRYAGVIDALYAT
jgi:long-chain acyl-CoA synthetase